MVTIGKFTTAPQFLSPYRFFGTLLVIWRLVVTCDLSSVWIQSGSHRKKALEKVSFSFIGSLSLSLRRSFSISAAGCEKECSSIMIDDLVAA